MTPKEFAKKMNELVSDDYETTHIEMDKLMADVLTELGYKEGVNVFNTTGKWYS